MSVKMTKQHIFIIENNLQKVGVIFSLVPSDNHDTRFTCPTSVFTGTGQSDKRLCLCLQVRSKSKDWKEK